MNIAVIGGGIAGTAAASELARQGARATVFHDRAGASALYSGALDLEVWDRAITPSAREPEETHFCEALGIWSVTSASRRVATLEGGLRPARGMDRALLDLERCAGKRVAVAKLERDEWDAELLARGWTATAWARETGTLFSAVRVPDVQNGFERRTSAYDFALAHDAPERARYLLGALRESGQTPEAWLFGPWLGIERNLAAELSDALGVPVGETTSAPGGAAGARFELARDRLLGRIADQERTHVTRIEPSNAGFRVEARDYETREFGAIVLASGGVAAGGIVLERSFERHGGTGFRLSLEAPLAIELDGEVTEGVSSLSSVDFVERGLGSLSRVGVSVNEDGAARDNPGIFVAGDAVSSRPRTALVAARSGILAARQALAHARGVG